LSDEVYPPRRRCRHRGSGSKGHGKERSCEPCGRQASGGGQLLWGGTLGHCVQRLGLIACLALPARVWAQLSPVGVPAGTVRVELDGSLETFDRRFRDGTREGYGADLSSPALGSD